MLRHNAYKEQGDTIVEVMIAIAVASLVLVMAYGTSTRNVNTLEDTQEHSEALQLAQAQIEYLHDASSTQRVMAASGGCFDNTGKPASGGSSTCEVNGSDSPVTATVQPQFLITLNGTINTSTGLTTYKVAITWWGLIDGQNDNVTLYYQQA